MYIHIILVLFESKKIPIVNSKRRESFFQLFSSDNISFYDLSTLQFFT